VFGLGQQLTQLDLFHSTSLQGALKSIGDYAKANGDHAWIRGRVWNQENWKLGRFPTAKELDAVVSDRPVWLDRVDSHAGWANSRALALAGITLGTLYQKKYCAGMDLRTGGCVQMGVASVVALALSLQVEGFQVRWTAALLLASGWLSVVNSIGAISLLFFMMRKGEASKVASLFYLIPGVTALLGFAVLGETLSVMALAGFAVTAGAVYVCTRATNRDGR